MLITNSPLITSRDFSTNAIIVLLQRLLESGPFSCAGYDSLSYVAEQVSHHPPGKLYEGHSGISIIFMTIVNKCVGMTYIKAI